MRFGVWGSVSELSIAASSRLATVGGVTLNRGTLYVVSSTCFGVLLATGNVYQKEGLVPGCSGCLLHDGFLLVSFVCSSGGCVSSGSIARACRLAAALEAKSIPVCFAPPEHLLFRNGVLLAVWWPHLCL